MGYYFRGTAEELLSSMHSDLRKATEPGPSDGYFNRVRLPQLLAKASSPPHLPKIRKIPKRVTLNPISCHDS